MKVINEKADLDKIWVMNKIWLKYTIQQWEMPLKWVYIFLNYNRWDLDNESYKVISSPFQL